MSDSQEMMNQEEFDETNAPETSERMPEYVAPKGRFLQKWREAAPYHMFLSTVSRIPVTRTQPLSVTFSEILDKSIGDLVQSLHTTMNVDLEWMWNQYSIADQQENTNVTVFHGHDPSLSTLQKNIKTHLVKCPSKQGKQHAKISIFQYRDNAIRIVVSSADLYRDDWELRTQGLWMSPHLSLMDASAKEADGESPTGFKRDFLQFLNEYPRDQMKMWKDIVSRADFSGINVFFVASAPTFPRFTGSEWGLLKLNALLREHMMIPENESRMSIVAQASSIGGSSIPNYDDLTIIKFVHAITRPDLAGEIIPSFKVILPTIEQVRKSLDAEESSKLLSSEKEPPQRRIRAHLQKWRADNWSRTVAFPQIKTFTRLSGDEKRIYFFYLGSPILSEAAWGLPVSMRSSLLSNFIKNYEAGVLFLPKFVTGENDFSVCDDPARSSPKFPMPYDLPLSPYSSEDKPFSDYL